MEKKKKFPIKYFRKGLFKDDESNEDKTKNKGKRRIRKPKLSVHMKTGIGKGKTK